MESHTPQPAAEQAAGHANNFQEFLRQIERKNWEQRTFYPQHDIRVWMIERTDLDPHKQQSNFEFLLHEAYENTTGHRSVFEPVHDTPKIRHKCLIVFAMLHSLGCGHSIHLFARYNIDDNLLERLSDELSLDRVYRALQEQHQPDRARSLAETFIQRRWEFFPAKITYNMDSMFSGNYILPFIFQKEINQKGGTANVHQYQIEADLVESKELHEILKPSKCILKNGKVGYSIAVKTYHTEQEQSYDLEIDAFSGCKDQQGIVKFLGQYHTRVSNRDIHHIMLEFGDRDLDEYLADTYPPVMFDEILAFWKDIFEIACTIRDLHSLNHNGRSFSGWHGDIKPDNILRVNGKYKLADFGFAKFERDKVVTQMFGGTHSFGAPECDSARNQTMTPQLQTIDTWSFGCVLSCVATWVVLGSLAYDQYLNYRQREIQKLKELKRTNKSISTPTADDAFHDGHNVLSAVLNWHNYLRNSIRKCDTISGQVLELIEKYMLLPDPSQRARLSKLCTEFERILVIAEHEYKKSVTRGDIQELRPDTLMMLYNLDKEAPHVAKPIQASRPDVNTGLKPGSRSNKVAKSVRYVGKTANREQVLGENLNIEPESSLGIQIRRTESPPPLETGFQDAPQRVNSIARAQLGEAPVRSPPPITFERVPLGASPVVGTPPWTPPSRPVSGIVTNEQPGPYGSLPGVYDRQPSIFQPQIVSPPTSPHTPRHGGYHSPGSPNALPPWIAPGSIPFISQPAVLPPPVLELYESQHREWTRHMKSKIFTFNFKSFRSTIQVDPQLQSYIIDRDIMFIVDNSSTMRSEWAIVHKVLLSLAMKIGSLDEDGLDMVFTNSTKKVSGAMGWKILTSLEEKMNEVWHAGDAHWNQTDLSLTLQPILDKYLENPKKRLTLVILTDGRWSGRPENVEHLIVDFLQKLQARLRKLEKRWFSIQFVAFGNDPAGMQRMEDLDDRMAEKYNIHDVIDTKRWDYEIVNMLIMGSITEDGDDHKSPPPGQQPSGQQQLPIRTSTLSPSPYLTPGAEVSTNSAPSRSSSTHSRTRSGSSLKAKLFGDRDKK